MTKKAKKRLQELSNETVRFSPMVQKKLSKSGSDESATLAQSAAKYYPALKKLAEK